MVRSRQGVWIITKAHSAFSETEVMQIFDLSGPVPQIVYSAPAKKSFEKADVIEIAVFLWLCRMGIQKNLARSLADWARPLLAPYPHIPRYLGIAFWADDNGELLSAPITLQTWSAFQVVAELPLPADLPEDKHRPELTAIVHLWEIRKWLEARLAKLGM